MDVTYKKIYSVDAVKWFTLTYNYVVYNTETKVFSLKEREVKEELFESHEKLQEVGSY